MNIEYEATFTQINKNAMRKKLENLSAKLAKAEFLQRRTVFELPKSVNIKNGWARVRDEGDRITMSIKSVEYGKSIHGQKETCINIGNYKQACTLLKMLGCKEKAYQESLRELWIYKNVEITIDTWPFLEPLVEVEGKSEKEVRKVSEELGFNWNDAKFCAAGTIYSEKYNISEDIINSHTPKIVFNMKNPFVK